MKLKAAYWVVPYSTGFRDFFKYVAERDVSVYAQYKTRKSISNKDFTIQFHRDEPLQFLSLLLKEKNNKPIALVVEFPNALQSVPQSDISLSGMLTRHNFNTINLIRYGIEKYKNILLLTDPLQAPVLLKALEKNQKLAPIQERFAMEALDMLKQHETTDRVLQNTRSRSIDETVSLIGGGSLPVDMHIDIQLAIEYIRELREPGVVIIDHDKQCSISEGASLKEAFIKALSHLRSFGRQNSCFETQRLIAVNRPVDQDFAHYLPPNCVGTIMAPAYEMESLMFLHTVPIKLLIMRRLTLPVTWSRLLKNDDNSAQVMDDRDLIMSVGGSLKVVTRRFPDPKEWRDLLFSWKIIRRSFAADVMVVKEQRVHGLSASQLNCFHDVTIALDQAAQEAQGATIAFRNFVPFKDGVELAGQFGIKAIIQPGGSVRDEEVISTADSYDIAMVFAGGGLSILGPVSHD